MAGRPIVVYISKSCSNDAGDLFDRNGMDAWSLYLSQYHGCDIRIFDWVNSFLKSAEQYRVLAEAGALVCVCLEYKRYEEPKWILAEIQFIKNAVSQTIPIVLFGSESSKIEVSNHACAHFSFCDSDSIEYVAQLVSGWSSPDWLGAETELVERMLILRLEHAHRVQASEVSVYETGVADENYRVVAEALRLHLLPSSCLKEEFDVTVPIKLISSSSFSAEIFNEKTERIRKMSESERKAFSGQVLTRMGYYQRADGLWLVRGDSLGHGVNGFAIDPVTLECSFTNRHGLHGLARDELALRIGMFESLRGNDPLIKNRIIPGLVFHVSGFRVPIGVLFLGDSDDDEDQRKVVRKICGDRRFIPVSTAGFLREG